MDTLFNLVTVPWCRKENDRISDYYILLSLTYENAARDFAQRKGKKKVVCTRVEDLPDRVSRLFLTRTNELIRIYTYEKAQRLFFIMKKKKGVSKNNCRNIYARTFRQSSRLFDRIYMRHLFTGNKNEWFLKQRLCCDCCHVYFFFFSYSGWLFNSKNTNIK